MSAADYYGQSGAYPQQQQQYASSSHLSPYSHTPNPYQRPTSTHSANGPYGSPAYTSRPSSTHSDMSGYVPPAQRQNQGQEQDGEKGLMATVLGGGAGGALGHKAGKGSKFKTFLGAAAGAVAANIVENKLKGSKQGHGKHGSHGYGQQQNYGPPPMQQGHYGHHGGPAPSGGFGGLLGAPPSHQSGYGSPMGGYGGPSVYQV
ncbi:hypothetical protein VSDG_00677 [Cytospora chrysosperma]|uniref:Glycine zipper 2TM domain-containing protein n=1 Tax=Cytospora chrysosperma TaxID=252740 RepID=A0A423WQB4_CYTCH|nr:hypothetical protein VSDG_00677 [Valsa sordida]